MNNIKEYIQYLLLTYNQDKDIEDFEDSEEKDPSFEEFANDLDEEDENLDNNECPLDSSSQITNSEASSSISLEKIISALKSNIKDKKRLWQF